MTRIQFLHGAPDRIASAADWLRSAWSRRQRALVYVPRSDDAERLDRMLWTHPPTGFLPHAALDSALASETPILMARNLGQVTDYGCLVNLADELPASFSRFEELIEIVSTDDAVRLPARERFRFYRERGYPIDARDISRGIES